MIHSKQNDFKRKIKILNPYSREAFRVWLTQSFSKETLKAAHLRAGTVKKVYFVLCGAISDKRQIIFEKNLETLAQLANLSKASTLKALRFLELHRFIAIDQGRGRRANSYINFLKETGIRTTKHLKQLPFINIRDYIMLRELGAGRAIKRAEFSVLTQILIFSNFETGLFLASKETIEGYSQLDRRTIDAAFKKLIERGILVPEKSFPVGSRLQNLQYRRGQRAYKVNRAAIQKICKPELLKPTPQRKNPRVKIEYGNPVDLVAEMKKAIEEYRANKAAAGPQRAAS